MSRTLTAVLAVALSGWGLGYIFGLQARDHHPQPCVRTYTADGQRLCVLDPVEGRWVR